MGFSIFLASQCSYIYENKFFCNSIEKNYKFLTGSQGYLL